MDKRQPVHRCGVMLLFCFPLPISDATIFIAAQIPTQIQTQRLCGQRVPVVVGALVTILAVSCILPGTIVFVCLLCSPVLSYSDSAVPSR